MGRLMICDCGSTIATNKPSRVKCGKCGRESLVDGGPAEPSVAVPREMQVPAVMAPGDALAKVIAGYGYPPPEGCQCDERRAEMNRLGMVGCVVQREAIIGWLVDAAAQSGWGGWLARRFAPAKVHRMAADMVDEALELAGYVRSDRIAIIMTHWNPAGFRRPGQTLRESLGYLRRPAQVMEVVYEDRYAEIQGSTVIPAGPRSVLWQKERLINLAVERLPPSVSWVAWVDHDLVWESDQWVEAAVRMLRGGMDCVQLFDKIKYLARDGQSITQTATSATAARAAGGVPNAAPGGAWMASRRWFDSIGGLYDRNVCGGGDATFFDAVTGSRSGYLERQAPQLRLDSIEYCQRVGGARWGCLPCSVQHLWHGERDHRQYHSRDQILARGGFCPRRDVRVNHNGLLEWTTRADLMMRSEVWGYFVNRREDG